MNSSCLGCRRRDFFPTRPDFRGHLFNEMWPRVLLIFLRSDRESRMENLRSARGINVFF